MNLQFPFMIVRFEWLINFNISTIFWYGYHSLTAIVTFNISMLQIWYIINKSFPLKFQKKGWNSKIKIQVALTNRSIKLNKPVLLDCVLLIIMDLKQYLNTKIWGIFDIIVKDSTGYYSYIIPISNLLNLILSQKDYLSLEMS